MAQLTKAEAKALDILQVAESLGMELKKNSSRQYYWVEHDSLKIFPHKNKFQWFSRTGVNGDPINLVQAVKNVTYKEAMQFLSTGEFTEAKPIEETHQPFRYTLAPFEKPLFKGRQYLKEVRGLSDETIDFFITQGVLAEANRKSPDHYYEDVLVFKYLDQKQELVGASLQGIIPNKKRYEGKGYLKQIMYQSQGIAGFNVSIGSPKRLVVAEAPIDLMSYYEANKAHLSDVRLVAMEGLKEATLSRYFRELLEERGDISVVPLDLMKSSESSKAGTFLATIAKTSTYFRDKAHKELITLAVDNDEAGRKFLTSLQKKGIPLVYDIPPIIEENDTKMDWNEYLKSYRHQSPLSQDDRKHVYSLDDKGWHYQGYFTAEIADKKVEGFFADEQIAFKSEKQLTNEEIREQVKRTKEKGLTMKDPIEGLVDTKKLTPEEETNAINFSDQPIKQMLAGGQEDYLIQFAYSESPVFSNIQKGELIPYKEFVTKLYQANYELYPKHTSSLSVPPDNLSSDNYIPYQKAKFHLLNADGEFLVSDIRYDIGEETETLGNLISRTELLELDQEVLKELGLEKVAETNPVQELSRQKGQKEEKSMAEEIKKVPETLITVDREKLSQLLRTMEQYGSAGVLVPLAYGGSLKNQIGIVAYDDLLSGSYSDTVRFVFDYAHRHFDFPSFDEYYSHKHLDNLDYYKQFEAQVKQFPVKEVMEKALEEGILTHSQLQEYDKKTPENLQEAIVSNSEQEKNAEGTIGVFPVEQEAAPLPEANHSQPLNDLSPNQTQPQPYLHFTIKEGAESIDKRHYHPITPKELQKLNRYAPHIQQAAQWYLENLADTQVTYFYQDGVDIHSVVMTYNRESFMHLTGVFPYQEGQTAEKSLVDFAEGRGDFETILLANKGAAFDKLKVLPELPAMIDAESFYFGDLSDVEKFQTLDLDKAIRSNDQDVLLAFRTVDNTTLPASLMRLRKNLNLQLDATNQEKTILGVYRERDGHIEQLSINEEIVKDGGKELFSILENRQYEKIPIEDSPSLERGNAEAVSTQNFHETLDTDHDGLFDYLEKSGVTQFDSPDTDGDGVSDYEELAQGTDPNDFSSNSYREEEKNYSSKEASPTVQEMIREGDTFALSAHLKEGMKAYLQSDHYKHYLDKMSQLNHYSSRNLQLILAQNPDATFVASFNKWRNEFGRFVKKGEKALKLLLPITYVKKDENNEPILDKDGQPQLVTTFKLKPVGFDVSQTTGKELPKALQDIQAEVSDKDYANLYRALASNAEKNQVGVRFEQLEGGARGYYDPQKHEIILNKQMGKADIIKTFLHETAHSELHNSKEIQSQQLTYSTAELQAESVAYVVSSYYGIDTSNYSFGYLANWSEDKKGLSDLEAQLEIVHKEAQSLIKRMDESLAQIKMLQAQKEQSFSNRLDRFKEKTAQAIQEKQQTQMEKTPSKKGEGILK